MEKFRVQAIDGMFTDAARWWWKFSPTREADGKFIVQYLERDEPWSPR